MHKNLGKKRTTEQKEKMRISHIGKIHSGSFKLGHSVSEEIRIAISSANKGKIPWNKGMELGEQSTEHRKKISDSHAGKSPLVNSREGSFRSIKRGWYDINGKKMFFRSMWEVNYAIYLDWLKSINQIKDWEYEADVFVFHKIQFGTRSYRPDFKITNNDGSIHYDEVKGWMDSKSKTKIKRMKKYYPEIKLTIIDGKEYSSIKRKVGKMLNFY